MNGDARGADPRSEVERADPPNDGPVNAHLDAREAEHAERGVAEFLARDLRQPKAKAPLAVELIDDQPQLGWRILDSRDDGRRGRLSAAAPCAREILVAGRRPLTGAMAKVRPLDDRVGQV